METNYETMPMREKVSPAACLGFRVCRPECGCCGGTMGVRRAFRSPKSKRAKHKTLRSHRQ